MIHPFFLNVHATTDEEIYKYDLMKDNHIEANVGASFENVQSLVDSLMEEYNVSPNQISLAFYDFQSDQHYYVNEHKFTIAASTIKAPIAALYIDLIQNQQLSLSSTILFKDSYLVEGAGLITNNAYQSEYTIEDLLFNAIVYSDNTAWYALMDYYNTNYSSYVNAILDFSQYYDVPDFFYQDNYASAYLAEQWLIKIATQPNYKYLINLMSQTEPDQLFTSYVDKGMANKYGRLENVVNDTGIYFENNQPQYILAVYTESLAQADSFLEMLNLRINEWHRAQYHSTPSIPTEVNSKSKAKHLKTDVEPSSKPQTINE